jgi:hypothetical protein
MDLDDAGRKVKYLIRDRDGKYPPTFDTILADAGITVVFSGVRMPRMNSPYGARKGSSPNSTTDLPDSSATTTAAPLNRPQRSWTRRA